MTLPFAFTWSTVEFTIGTLGVLFYGSIFLGLLRVAWVDWRRS